MATLKIGDPTPRQLALANAEAKRFAMSRGLVNAQNFHVGNTLPKYIDSATGKELPPATSLMQLQPRTITDIRQIPYYVKPEDLQFDTKANQPYYIDEKTGDIQYVHPLIRHSSRFNPNRGKSAETILSLVKK